MGILNFWKKKKKAEASEALKTDQKAFTDKYDAYMANSSNKLLDKVISSEKELEELREKHKKLSLEKDELEKETAALQKDIAALKNSK